MLCVCVFFCVPRVSLWHFFFGGGGGAFFFGCFSFFFFFFFFFFFWGGVVCILFPLVSVAFVFFCFLLFSLFSLFLCVCVFVVLLFWFRCAFTATPYMKYMILLFGV